MDSNNLAGNLYMLMQIQENMFLLSIQLFKLPDRLDRHILLDKDHKFYSDLSSEINFTMLYPLKCDRWDKSLVLRHLGNNCQLGSQHTVFRAH
jgi:hypothetical protein